MTRVVCHRFLITVSLKNKQKTNLFFSSHFNLPFVYKPNLTYILMRLCAFLFGVHNAVLAWEGMWLFSLLCIRHGAVSHSWSANFVAFSGVAFSFHCVFKPEVRVHKLACPFFVHKSLRQKRTCTTNPVFALSPISCMSHIDGMEEQSLWGKWGEFAFTTPPINSGF